tara:strand:- start:214 stop:462 length:249 start_codon:yes stop_codon:yes gene_type:complete
MKHLTKGYIVQQINDIVALKKLQGESINMSKSRIEDIADSILFEWNEIDDPDTNFGELLLWEIDKNLRHDVSSESYRRSGCS